VIRFFRRTAGVTSSGLPKLDEKVRPFGIQVLILRKVENMVSILGC
jgi:hypothetical protein